MIKKLWIITGALFFIILSLGFISSWYCNDGTYIPDSWVCDGYTDCAGGEDEAGCCTPNCAGKDCGSDGCGGSCGSCSGSTPYCSSGSCVECTSNVHCAYNEDCISNNCVCTDTCSSKGYECGYHTICGSTENCGTCSPPKPYCTPSGTCVKCLFDYNCKNYNWCSGDGWYAAETCWNNVCVGGFYTSCGSIYQTGGDTYYCQRDSRSCSGGACVNDGWSSINQGQICSQTNYCSGDGYYAGKKCNAGACSSAYGYTACGTIYQTGGDPNYCQADYRSCNSATATCQNDGWTNINQGLICSQTAYCLGDGYYAGKKCSSGACSGYDYTPCADASCFSDGDGTYSQKTDSTCPSTSCTPQTTSSCANGYACDGITSKEDGNACTTAGACTSNNQCVDDYVCVGGNCGLCGNGVLNTGEVCDDGANNGVEGYCWTDCTRQTTYCGDGVTQSPNDGGFDEECDGETGCTDCVWFPEAFWADSEGNEIITKTVILECISIDMILRYTGFASGTAVDFEIWEYDLIGSNDYITTISNITDSAGAVNIAWIPTQEDMDKTSDYNKFFFIVKDASENEIAESGYLDITIIGVDCGLIHFCSDYTEGLCGADAELCGVADASVEANNPNIICGEEGIECHCFWNESGGVCESFWEAEVLPRCGDGKIDPSLGETCDGTTMPFTTCSGGNVDLCTGGAVYCYPPGHDNECTLDKSGCTGCNEEGFCGDSLINNLYETCDTANLSGKTCADSGLCGDGLACYPPEHTNNCTFNTTGCVACESHPSKIGNCTYDENTDDDCDDNFLTYSWTATWIWDSENIFDVNPDGGDYIPDGGKWHYDPNEASKKCVDGTNTVPCPAQIELPFFDSYSIVIILVLITLIYVILTWKKKKFNSKGKVKKK